MRNLKPPRRTTLLVLPAVGVIVAGALAVAARGRKAAADPPAPATRAAPVTLAPVTGVRSAPREEITGSLRPARTLQLAFEVGGRLSRVEVARGSTVTPGQVVARLDPELARAQLQQAEGALRAAEAQADLAGDAARRQARLREAGSISEWQARASASQARAADAQVQMARAALLQARVALDRHTLRAPFAGTVTEAPDQAGAAVVPGAPLVTVEELDTLSLRVTVPEDARDLLPRGARVHVEAVGGKARTDDAWLRAVIPSAETATRRLPVEIVVPNGAGRFTAHTLARAVLTLGEERSSSALPSSALLSAGGDHVLVADSDGRVRRVAVSVVDRGARQVTVNGLPAEARVIDFPAPDLAEGSPVEVSP